MKNSIKYLIIFALGIALVSCKDKNKNDNQIIRPVVVLDLNTQNQNGSSNYPGMVVAKNDTVLSFKVAGSIKSINVVAGDYVKKGQVIATLEQNDYNVNLNANKDKYLAAKAQYENMKKQYARAKILHDGHAMSDKNFDIVTAEYQGAKAIASANLQSYRNAKNKLQDTNITAPYNGYIGNKFLDKGSVVGPGTPVVSIVSKGIKRIEINVAGKDLGQFTKDKNYNFITDTQSYPLTLIKVGKQKDFLKLTYPVTLQFKKSNKLLAGKTGEVIVESPIQNKNEIVIPIKALFDKDNKGSYVYLYKDGKAVAQKVTLGEFKNNGNIVITSGLKMTDKVITAGVHTISDGQKVKILPKPSATNVGDIL